VDAVTRVVDALSAATEKVENAEKGGRESFSDLRRWQRSLHALAPLGRRKRLAPASPRRSAASPPPCDSAAWTPYPPRMACSEVSTIHLCGHDQVVSTKAITVTHGRSVHTVQGGRLLIRGLLPSLDSNRHSPHCWNQLRSQRSNTSALRERSCRCRW